MEKHRYYVNVATNEILAQPGESDTAFEIDATEADLARLEELFDRRDDEEQISLVRVATPYERFDTLSGDQDERNEPFDRRLRDIYWLVYDLGTARTCGQIEEMGILKAQR